MLYLWQEHPIPKEEIMGIFTRFKDIVNSNINAMLDRAEDPEKMIKLMIHEMEDTLIELKSSCAGVIAGQKKVDRRLDTINEKINLWNDRANLAVRKARDDLAREALLEKRRYTEVAETLEQERAEYDGLIKQYHNDIAELEEKLASAKEKKRLLVQRHKRAQGKKKAQEEIKRSTSSDTMARFDKLESRIEQMEAEADLVNVHKKPTLDEKLHDLEVDDEIENELERIKEAQFSKQDPKQDSGQA